MPGQCCSKTLARSRALMLATYARQSVLCGVLGAMKFVIALAALVQSYIFLQLCKKGLHEQASGVLKSNIHAAKTNLILGILPAFEMFVLAPATFVVLHTVLNVGMIYCFAACFALMFTVCFTVRASGKFKGCPSIEHPIYKDGLPFPRMTNKGGYTGNLELFQFTDSSLSIVKAYALALLFVPLRAVTALAQAVLVVAELVSLPVVFVADVCGAFFRFCASKISSSHQSQHDTDEIFQASKESVTCALSLVKTLMTDLLWVMTLGVSGVPSLRAATKVRYDLRNNPMHTATKPSENTRPMTEENRSPQAPSHCCQANPPQKHETPGATVAEPTQPHIEPEDTTNGQTLSQGMTPTVLQGTTSTTCCHREVVAS